ncbi:MAG: TolC family protein [Pseudomonadota bacterium]
MAKKPLLHKQQYSDVRPGPKKTGRAFGNLLSLGVAALFMLGAPTAWAAETIGLDEAVEIALDANDPTVVRFEERAEALDERAIADSQLPDPQLRVGLANFPVDTFDFEQEAMTQVQVGMRQSFPRGKTLSKTREKRYAQAAGERAGGLLQELQIALDTRSIWLELYYWYGARETVRESREAVAELVDVIEASFATGVQSNQDLLRAELELSLLDDRAVEVERQIEALTAELARLIGEGPARRELPSAFPNLTALTSRQAIEDALARHPSILMENARIDASNSDVDIARQEYKPGFSLDIGYGGRGGNRPDFASAMIVFDVPLFTKDRQDRRVSAARKNRSAARMDRAAKLLELKKRLDLTYANYARLGERVELFERVVVNRASANADAALDGYQNQVADFAELIRSRLAALDTELKLRRLRVDRAQAQSQLLFLTGERT